jgi:hypothetical protein
MPAAPSPSLPGPAPASASTFIPGTCPYCQKRVARDAYWCVHCRRELPRTEFTPDRVSREQFARQMKRVLKYGAVGFAGLSIAGLIASLFFPTPPRDQTTSSRGPSQSTQSQDTSEATKRAIYNALAFDTPTQIAKRYDISVEEVTKIKAEGDGKHWTPPPAPPTVTAPERSGTTDTSRDNSSDDLNARVSFNGTQFVITNNDSRNWTDIECEINGGFFSGGYKLRVGSLDSGDTITVGALRFAKSDGTRFNPFEVKPQKFAITATVSPSGHRAVYMAGWE